MFAEERQRKIIELLEETNSLKVTELAIEFKVSESTIRRDFQEMEKKNLLKRTHGGAVDIRGRSFEPTFKEKKEEYLEEKETIGRLAADLVEDGDAVILDTGTTTLEIAKRLKHKSITVITNSLDVAEELSESENIELIMTGGVLRGNTRAMVGTLAEGTLRNFKADLAFIGVNGLDLDAGLTTPNHVEASTKKAMMNASHKIYVACDESKFNRVSFAVIASVNELTGVVTAGNFGEKDLDAYEALGLHMVREEGV